MIPDRLGQMEMFLRVVDRGSFSAAARDAGTTQSAASKQIQSLEERLGVRLVTRTTRSLTLTEEGRRFAEAARAAIDAARIAEEAAAPTAAPTGVLKMAAPVGFGQLQLVRRIADYRRRYPEVGVDLQLADHFVDMIEEGIELAIRIGELSDSSLATRRIGLAKRVCVAAPAYLKRFDAPKTPEDLLAHEHIIYTRLRDPVLRFAGPKGEIAVEPKGKLRSDSSIAVREMALAGLGVACNPLWLYSEDLRAGRLVEVLADYAPAPMPIHAVTPARRFTPARVTAMIDLLAASFRSDPYLAG